MDALFWEALNHIKQPIPPQVHRPPTHRSLLLTGLWIEENSLQHAFSLLLDFSLLLNALACVCPATNVKCLCVRRGSIAFYICWPKERGLGDFEALTFYSNKLFTSASQRNLTHVNFFCRVDWGFSKTFDPHHVFELCSRIALKRPRVIPLLKYILCIQFKHWNTVLITFHPDINVNK